MERKHVLIRQKLCISVLLCLYSLGVEGLIQYHHTSSDTSSHFRQSAITMQQDKPHQGHGCSITAAILFHHCHKHISHLPFGNILP